MTLPQEGLQNRRQVNGCVNERKGSFMPSMTTKIARS